MRAGLFLPDITKYKNKSKSGQGESQLRLGCTKRNSLVG